MCEPGCSSPCIDPPDIYQSIKKIWTEDALDGWNWISPYLDSPLQILMWKWKSCSNISKYTVGIIFSVSGMIASQSVVCGQAKGNQRFVNLWFTKHQAAVPSPLALYCDFESIHLSVKYIAQTERHLVSAKYWLRIVHYIQTLIWVESYKCSLLQSSSRHPNTQNLEKLWNVKPTSALKWKIEILQLEHYM